MKEAVFYDLVSKSCHACSEPRALRSGGEGKPLTRRLAALAGAAVSFAGLVGFVGLRVPHAARFLVGTRHRDLLLASMLLGALLVTVCDLLGRVLFAPFELPVGILLSLLGGPFFLWLLFRQRGGRRL